MSDVQSLYDRYMVWHRAHRGRLCACYFFVVGWTIFAMNILGVVLMGDTNLSSLLVMSAVFVSVGGGTVLFDLFYRIPKTWLMVAWGFFGSGLTFWTFIAADSWPLFALSAAAGWWQVWVVSGSRHKHMRRQT